MKNLGTIQSCLTSFFYYVAQRVYSLSKCTQLACCITWKTALVSLYLISPLSITQSSFLNENFLPLYSFISTFPSDESPKSKLPGKPSLVTQCGLRTSCMDIAWELVRHVDSQPPPQPTAS